MERKNVTPISNKKNSFFKKFGIGLLGGVVGGVLIIGGTYAAVGMNVLPSPSATNTNNSLTPAKSTKVSNINYNVNSDVTKAVNKTQDSVVSVINLQQKKSSSDLDGLDGLFGNDDNNNKKNKDNSSGGLEAASEGSGVIYKKDGNTAYVVTNNHVVDQSNGLEVILHDGTKVKGKLVGKDAYTDLAVIKIAAQKVDQIATFGDSSKLKVGEPAIAIGSPLGSEYANSVTQGIISSVNRNITNANESGETVNINAIQTDAAINPGNSGGPLINIEGQVIGINSIKILQANSQVNVEGMGFAIPSNDVVSIINQLEAKGKVTRPALGITMEDLSNISSQQQEEILKLPSSIKSGIVVLSVQAATPADKSGLKKYDVITKVDGENINTITDLQSALYKKNVGDSMEVTYYRESKEHTASVDLTIDKSALKQPSIQENR
ncbi:S1C family serine protease [Melissococcus plutonius]|uniref:S1C family serine protease n=1 Tax=Melissococcus plutonius TaxID=33970 RepID=UPI00065E94FB|nr:trypsin-like peptidase domain-containing protein [Melissococcus plutonius]AIM25516.1 serine protease Do-like HtrA [Melissococcus plutonius S1]KMT24568.1 serine protease Do-like HtrA [Melissococcus plutonius]KMT27281.1 serine protease Do-like HtrA [Melissococcus plutonius]KMT27454.1 serine protease Do-like HtrA [Melissococcus plutonius]KMT29228.1 serine protease Do-like HtrA [Melissococcus plutonius]